MLVIKKYNSSHVRDEVNLQNVLHQGTTTNSILEFNVSHLQVNSSAHDQGYDSQLNQSCEFMSEKSATQTLRRNQNIQTLDGQIKLFHSSYRVKPEDMNKGIQINIQQIDEDEEDDEYYTSG